jgi:hypothetical protein
MPEARLARGAFAIATQALDALTIRAVRRFVAWRRLAIGTLRVTLAGASAVTEAVPFAGCRTIIQAFVFGIGTRCDRTAFAVEPRAFESTGACLAKAVACPVAANAVRTFSTGAVTRARARSAHERVDQDKIAFRSSDQRPLTIERYGSTETNGPRGPDALHLDEPLVDQLENKHPSAWNSG